MSVSKQWRHTFAVPLHMLEAYVGGMLRDSPPPPPNIVRSKLRRACAAAALAALAALPAGRLALARAAGCGVMLSRLVDMLRCGVESMDAAMATLLIANLILNQSIRVRPET